jgi:valyl-tRNA synthetase
MAPLAEPAMEAVRQGKIEFVPERFAKIYMGWMQSIRDWCISRQLWWGHRIPVWYCTECSAEICALDDVTVCTMCGSPRVEQDEDVLDTWFSSALWPFATMGWPQDSDDLKHFYPTSVLVTGRDIIFFWVARMIFMGLEFMKDVPFDKVMIHGLILDRNGRKMAKSLGNGIDPLEVIESYGADTLRFMLLTGNTPGNDLRFYEERLESTRKFLTKRWNASRFGLMNLEGYEPAALDDALDDAPGGVPGGVFGDVPVSVLNEMKPDMSLADRWILSRYEGAAEEVTRRLEEFDLGEAGRLLYEFVWNELCDWYIELAKPRLYGRAAGTTGPTTPETAQMVARTVLYTVLEGTMRLLHPFLPFLTEEIWQHLPHAIENLNGKTIMLRPWPQPAGFRDEKLEKDMGALIEVIRSVRNIRSEYGVTPGRKIKAALFCTDADVKGLISGALTDIELMASCEAIEVLDSLEGKPPQSASAALDGIQIFVPLRGLLDFDKERAKVSKDIAAACDEEKRLSGKLANPGFVNKAPADVIAKEQEKLTAVQKRIEALRQRQSDLKDE